MKTIRKLIYGEVLQAVGLVTLGFLALFLFFDLVEEIQSVGRHAAAGYTVVRALTYVTLLIPGHFYELMPIAVLIGTIFVMARLAQSSEYTILRTSGLGPWQALQTLLLLGLAFVVLTFAVGDYVSPLADRTAQLLKSRYTGRITMGHTGAWLKESRASGQCIVNVGELLPDGNLQAVRMFELDPQGRIVSVIQAQSAQMIHRDGWELYQVVRTEFPAQDAESLSVSSPAGVTRMTLPTLYWPNKITAEMISTALLKPERMRTIDLFQYIQHLQNNAQSAQRYEIEFWKKVFYPLSGLVMVVLALPFAYLHFRSGSIATYVFLGVMAGISFFLLNNVFGYMGDLQKWRPWLTAALPGMMYSVLSLMAFGWLVLKR